MMNCGDVAAGSVVHVPWSTNGADGAAITRATDGSIRVYKDSSATQRSSSAGITDTEDFDSITGVHLLTIDTSDNTDAGFYAAAHNYHVMLVAATIDGKTVNSWLATFSIENRTATTGGAPTVNQIADGIMQRASSNWEAGAPAKSLGGAVMKLTHKVDSAAGTLTVKRSNDSTTAYTQTETTDAAANPLIGLSGAS